MKTIHKFIIELVGTPQSIQVRTKAKLLKVAAQAGAIALWYEVDTFEGWQTLHFIVYETGKEFDVNFQDRQKYIDTVFFDSAQYVLHVYEITSR